MATITQLRARYGDAFQAFWRVYPLRTHMVEAERAFFAAAEAGYNPVVIIEKARAFARSQDPDRLQYCPAPNKWLANRQWEDNDLFTDQRLAEKEWLNGCWERADVAAVEARFQIKMPRVNAPDGMEAEDIPNWYKNECRKWIRAQRDRISE